MLAMKEITMTAWTPPRYLPNGELNPERIERYYVRAKTKRRALELLGQHSISGPVTPYIHRNYGGDGWGASIDRPAHEGEGVWITRDHSSRELVPVWVDSPNSSVRGI